MSYIYIYDISSLMFKWKTLLCGADDIIFILDLGLGLFGLLDLFIFLFILGWFCFVLGSYFLIYSET